MTSIDDILRRFGADPSAAPPDELEEFVYAMAAQELRDGNPRQGIMARAFADSNGDKKRTEAQYLRLRAAQLAREYERAVEAERQRKAAVRPKPKPYDPSVPPNPRPTQIILGVLTVVIVLLAVVVLLVNA